MCGFCNVWTCLCVCMSGFAMCGRVCVFICVGSAMCGGVCVCLYEWFL
jgi:hypothetical protein